MRLKFHIPRTTGGEPSHRRVQGIAVYKRVAGNGHELVYNQFGVGGTVDTPAVFFEDKCQVVYIECAPQYGTGMEVVTFFQVVVLEADTPILHVSCI